jgi:HEPN domain-containing protein
VNPHIEQAKALLAAARRDQITFRILRRAHEAPAETTLFHAQQAIEKGLKSVLVVQGIVFPRTHDLIELCELASRHSIIVPVNRELIARLGPYAVEFRYFGVKAPEVTLAEAEAAVEALMAWAHTQMA